MALTEAIRAQLRTLFTTAVAAIDPRTLIGRAAAVDHNHLLIHSQQQGIPPCTLLLPERVFIIGAGKGAGLLAPGSRIYAGSKSPWWSRRDPHRHRHGYTTSDYRSWRTSSPRTRKP